MSELTNSLSPQPIDLSLLRRSYVCKVEKRLCFLCNERFGFLMPFPFCVTVVLRNSETSMKILNLLLGRWRIWWTTSVLSLRYATEDIFFNCVSVSNRSLFAQGNFTSLLREKLIGFHRSGFRIWAHCQVKTYVRYAGYCKMLLFFKENEVLFVILIFTRHSIGWSFEHQMKYWRKWRRSLVKWRVKI